MTYKITEGKRIFVNRVLISGLDHTREYVPVVAWSPAKAAGADLGIRESFCDLGATVADFFGAKAPRGKSFLRAVRG